MSNFEEPTFEPTELPSDISIKISDETDFELLQQGMSPHEVAEARQQIKRAAKVSEIYKSEVLEPFLVMHGVESEEELTDDNKVELAFKAADWYRERRELADD